MEETHAPQKSLSPRFPGQLGPVHPFSSGHAQQDNKDNPSLGLLRSSSVPGTHGSSFTTTRGRGDDDHTQFTGVETEAQEERNAPAVIQPGSQHLLPSFLTENF